MAASKSQGRLFALFLAGGTVLCGGIAYVASGTGRLLSLVGAAIMVASLAGFLKIKPLEGETPLQSSPETMKWIGAGVAALGWVVTNGGRIVIALLGIGVTLFGILYVLPAAFNKTAFWKKPAGTSARAGLTRMAGKVTMEQGFTPTPSAMESARMESAR